MRSFILCCALMFVALNAIPASAQGPRAPVTSVPGKSASARSAGPALGVPVSLAELATRVQPAVVTISIRQTITTGGRQSGRPPGAEPPSGGNSNGGGGDGVRSRRATEEGSGFIISPDGYVVTNNHVVAPEGDNARVDRITLTLSDGRELQAKVVGRDPATDLAVLKVEAGNLPFVRFGDSARARVGDWVVVMGNPFGLGMTAGVGIVSALHRNLDNGPFDRYIQTDASINHGNSGGPMFDLNGNVIGINTILMSPSGTNVGVGFAIPAEQASPVVEALRRGERPLRGYLGFSPQAVDNDNLAEALGITKNSGDLVRTVTSDGPAHVAGIVQGDIITRVNGRPVTREDRVSYLVSTLALGARVPLEVMRDGERRTVTVTVVAMPTDAELAKLTSAKAPVRLPVPALQSAVQRSTSETLGIALQPLTPELARSINITDSEPRGVVVSSLDPSGNAPEGIRRRDVILSVNQFPVGTAEDVAAMVEAARREGRKTLLLLVKRGRAPSNYVGVRILGM